MTWLNVGMLGIGGALISVPVILHFLFQPKPVSVDFPALRFLKQKQQTTRSRMQLKHIALLLIRCLLIALAALALAGPSVASNEFGNWLTLGGVGFSGLVVALVAAAAFFKDNKNWLLIGVLGAFLLGHLVFGGVAASRLINSETTSLIGDTQAPIAALVVVDTSPRMELEFENESRLSKAKAFGQWLVSQFPGDSQVCVAATDGDQPFFSVDTGAADRRMTKLETNFSGAKIPETILAGLETLEESALDRKEIYVLSDLTAEAWSGEGTKKLLRKLKQQPDTSLFVVDVGVENPSDFALGPLNLSAVEIGKDGRVSVSTVVSRIGDAAQRTIKMQVEKIDASRPVVRDGKTLFPESYFPVQSISADIRQNGTAPAKFTFSQPLDVGTYHGSVEIEGQDGLAINDERFFTFRVSKTRKTLVVHPENVNPQVMRSLLAPQADVEAGSARFDLQVVDQIEFNQMEDFAGFDAVFLLDPDPIVDTQWQRLETYVQGGGGLGLFLGRNANDQGIAHASFLSDSAVRVIGGRLDQQWFDETGDLFLSPKELSHPVFNPIQGSETAVLWNRFGIFKHWGIELNADEADLPTQTILRYSNREPAVVERTIGDGRVLTMTTPVTEYGFAEGRQIWNRLLTGKPVPLFLLLTGMVSHLVQNDAESLNVLVGQASVLQNDFSENPDSYQVFSPIEDKPPTTLNTVDGRVRYRFNEAPGHYRYRGLFNDEVVTRGFSSNLPPAATQLARVDASDLDEVLGADRYQLATQQNQITRQQGTVRRGQELYPIIVMMMLLMLAVEYLMSNRFYS
jgi:hypothetical protein